MMSTILQKMTFAARLAFMRMLGTTSIDFELVLIAILQKAYASCQIHCSQLCSGVSPCGRKVRRFGLNSTPKFSLRLLPQLQQVRGGNTTGNTSRLWNPSWRNFMEFLMPSPARAAH